MALLGEGSTEGSALQAKLQELQQERLEQDNLFDRAIMRGLLDSFDVNSAALKLSSTITDHRRNLDELNGLQEPSQDFAQRMQHTLAIMRKRPDAARLLDMAGASMTVAQVLASGLRSAEAEASFRQLAMKGAPQSVVLQQQVEKGITTMKGLARSLQATTGAALGDPEDPAHALSFAEAYVEFLKLATTEMKAKMTDGQSQGQGLTKNIDDIIKVLGGEWDLAQIHVATRAVKARSMLQVVRDAELKDAGARVTLVGPMLTAVLAFAFELGS